MNRCMDGWVDSWEVCSPILPWKKGNCEREIGKGEQADGDSQSDQLQERGCVTAKNLWIESSSYL